MEFLFRDVLKHEALRTHLRRRDQVLVLDKTTREILAIFGGSRVPSISFGAARTLTRATVLVDGDNEIEGLRLTLEPVCV